MAPQYAIDDCQLVAATSRRHQLRLSDNFKCAIISTNSRLSVDDRTFAASRSLLEQSASTHLPAFLTLNNFFLETKDIFYSLRHQYPVTLFLGTLYKLFYLLKHNN